ncbi:MAG: cytochrome c nitrite reductase small subunit [Phycisphaerae bacterium]|nr:cytochrome c nitrite reductase small subunit [Phycisphaerae bacterium]
MSRERRSAGSGQNRRRRRAWLPIATVVMIGAFVGLGAFTFGYGKGAAYLSNDPAACANCHVMQSAFDSWQHSGHHHVATCNDCHLAPHPIGKWIVKADNGFFHSLAFTTGNFHEPIQIKPRNRRVTQDACVHCHRDFVHEMLPATRGGDMLDCIHCHRDVGHAQR